MRRTKLIAGFFAIIAGANMAGAASAQTDLKFALDWKFEGPAAPYFVAIMLKSPDIPSILVETAFISNPEEERKLNDEDYQDKLVGSIVNGIKKYFAGNPALAKSKVAKD